MQSQKSPQPAVSAWLFACLMLIAATIIVNGLMRLNESGLSITDWKPITSLKLPTNDDEFQGVLDEYKKLPQFAKSFPNMQVEEFKAVYTLEFANYTLVFIGQILFVLPFLVFFLMRKFTTSQIAKLVLVFIFGNMQSLFYNYMWQNSLLDDPHFSPYRLSLQLVLSFTFFALVLWQLLTISYPKPGIGGFELPKPPLFLKVFACLTFVAISSEIILGGALSGLHSPLSFNTFPMMDGQWIPEGLWPFQEPVSGWYKNFFEDVPTVQFSHRMVAYFLTIFIPLFCLFGRNNPHIAHLLPILFSMFVVEFLLGVLTLLFLAPVPLAALHQAIALLVFGISVTTMHRLFLPIKSIAYDVGIVAV